MVLNFSGSFTFDNLLGKNIIIFVDNRKKDILIIGKGPSKRLDDIILAAELLKRCLLDSEAFAYK